MRTNDKTTKQLALAFGLFALVLSARAARAAEQVVNLAAHRVEVTIAGEQVPVWLFSEVTIRRGEPVLPNNPGLPSGEGDFIEVPPGDGLRINLYNFLPEATSVVIPGQPLPAVDDAGTPVPQAPVRVGARIRSLVPETPAYNVATDTPGLRSYSWSVLREGTYLFRSGSHVNVQVPMGLYGVIQKDFAAKQGPNPAQAYDGHPYARTVGILISEIDPVQNQAVDTGVYGTASHPSTIHYSPKYYLVGGKPNAKNKDGGLPKPIVVDRDKDIPVLLRFVNAGLETHVPMLLGSHLKLIAEDGNLYPYAKELSAITLPAGKTTDAIFIPPAADQSLIDDVGKTYPLFDRRLFLSNGPLDFTKGDNVNDTKGMLTAIFVGPKL